MAGKINSEVLLAFQEISAGMESQTVPCLFLFLHASSHIFQHSPSNGALTEQGKPNDYIIGNDRYCIFANIDDKAEKDEHSESDDPIEKQWLHIHIERGKSQSQQQNDIISWRFTSIHKGKTNDIKSNSDKIHRLFYILLL